MKNKTYNIICSQLFGKSANTNAKFLNIHDTEKKYRRNCKRYGKDWYYFNKEITYKVNSNGFRTLEFKNIDWKNSIVVFGDSYTFGEGNIIDDVFTTILQNMIEIPVINLGIGGAGIDRSCWNSLALHESYPKPKALIHLWSGLYRYSEWDSTCDSWKNHLPARRGYCADHEWHLRNTFCVKTDRALWRDKVPYLEASVFEDTAKKLQVYKAEIVDYGRDEDHWGAKSNLLMAEYFFSKLKELGVA